MRKSYDFSKSVRNPYARRMKKQVTIRIDEAAIAYFKALGEERGDSLSEPDELVLGGVRYQKTPTDVDLTQGASAAAKDEEV
jgi:hypothetical protein